MSTYGVGLGRWTDGAALVSSARRAEADGFDVVTAADHLGAPSPFTALAAAAAVTERVRLRTYVLDAGFWNPALLAREVATLDLLSGGRVELGIGAGHMRHEHEDAGLPFPAVRERWALVESLVADVRRRLASEEHVPAAVQRPVPVMVAAMGETGLRCAARVADLVGLSGLLQVPGQRAGTFTFAGSDVVLERTAMVHELAGAEGRAPTLDVLLQHVEVGVDPQEAADRWVASAAADGATWFTAEMLLASPFVLLAPSAEAGRAELAAREALLGVTSWSTHPPSHAALAQVLAAR